MTEEITVNRVRMDVTIDLADAHRELRCQGYLSLWVGILCIDQTNIAERGREVLRMADIYRSPFQIIV